MKAAPSAPATLAEFLDAKVQTELAASASATPRARSKLARRLVVRSTAYGLVKRCVTVANLEAWHGETPLSRRVARRLAKVLEAQSYQLINTIAA